MLFTFAELLRSYRERASFDQAALATALGIHRNTIGRWEQGDYRPRHRELILRIAEELSLSPGETDQLLRAADFPGENDKWARAAALPVEQCAPPQLAARHQLRPPVADFVGRGHAVEQLAMTLRTALAARRGAVIAAVQGMGGVGKTELAYDVAYRLDDLVPNAQILLDLRGSSAAPLTPSQAMQTVMRVFSPGAKLPDDLAELQPLYRSALHGQRVLILADDARDAAQVQPLIPPAGCALLITSRLRFSLPGMAALHLEPLDQQAAVALLRQVCARLSEAEAQALAQACGQLPLALCISGGIVRNDIALPVAAYLQQLSDQRQRLHQLRDPDDPQLDVEASLALSYAQLDVAAQRAFRRLGVLVADFTTALAQLVLADVAPPELEQLLRMMLRRNLVMYDATRDRWRLHDLVRDLARRYLEAAGEWEYTQAAFASGAVQIIQAIDAQYSSGGDTLLVALARFDAERPHIDAARRWLTTRAGTAEADALLVADARASFFFSRMRYHRRHECLPQFECALAAARRLGDRHGEAMILTNLGRIMLDLGETRQALAPLAQALAILRVLGDEAIEGIALNSQGLAYVDLGEARRALPSFTQALLLAQSLGDRRLEAITLHNLGFAYANMGHPQRAIVNFERSLAIVRAIGDQRMEGITLDNLAAASTDLGELRGALAYSEQSLRIARAMGDRLSEGRALTTLALTAADLGDAQQALEQGRRALEILQEIGDQRTEGYALCAIGAGYAIYSDHTRAIDGFEAALARFRAVGARYGEAECSWRYGQALAGWGAWEQALPLLQATIAYEQAIGHLKAAEHAAMLERMGVQLEAGG